MKPQLFLIHFAGGNCYSYQFLQKKLSLYFDFIPLELPGRGKRMGENLLTSKQLAAQDIVLQIQKLRTHGRNYVIYGHSMGALLGYEAACLMEEQNDAPMCLITSGNAGPEIEYLPKRYDLPTEKFKDELKKLGGIPDEVLNSDELFHFFEPILKADFHIVEEDDIPEKRKINIPIYVCMGEEEDKVEKISNWKNYTSQCIQTKILKGNHFFIYENKNELSSMITRFAQIENA